MKARLILLFFIIASAVLTMAAQTPTYVERRNGSNTLNSSNFTSYTVPIGANPTLSGNCVMAAFEFGSGVASSWTVTTDKSDTLTAGPAHASGNSQEIAQFFGVATAGAQFATITFTGGQPHFLGGQATSFYNTNCTADGAGKSTSGTSTSPAPGNYTTTVNGDLLWTCMEQDSIGGQQATPTTISAGSGQTPLAIDQPDQMACEYSVQATASTTTNPGFTLGTSRGWNVASMALKAASTGTAPSSSAVQVNDDDHFDIQDTITQNPVNIKFTCSSSVTKIVVAYLGGAGDTLNSISDGTNTYTFRVTDSNLGYLVIADTGTTAVTCPATYTIAFHLASAGGCGACNIAIYGVQNFGAFDSSATCGLGTAGACHSTGTQSLAGTGPQNLTTTTITPSTSSGMIIGMVGVTSNTITGISTPGGFVDIATSNPIANISPIENNNGFLIYLNTSTSSKTLTWTTTNNESNNGVGTWNSVAVAYLAASGPTNIPNQFPRVVGAAYMTGGVLVNP